jgi:PAS domain S-box-containing protein
VNNQATFEHLQRENLLLKQKLKDLAEDDTTFRTFVEQAAFSVLLVSEAGRIVYANKCVAKDFGYQPQELIGQPLEMLVPAVVQKDIRRYLKSANPDKINRPMGMQEGVFAYHKDGHTFPIEFNLSSLQYQGAPVLAVTIFDFSASREKRHIEERAARRIRLLYEASSQSDMNDNQRITGTLQLLAHFFEMDYGFQCHVNKATGCHTLENVFSRHNGLRPEQFFVKEKTTCLWTMTENRPTVWHRNGQTTSLRHFADDKVPINTVVTVPLEVHNKPYGTISLGSSEAKAIELDETDISLLGLVSRWVGSIIEGRQVKEVLRLYADELEDKNKELQEFSHIVSHDLREPLRTIISFSNILEEDLADKLDEESREYLDFITGAAERMSELITKLLEYSRLGRVAVKYLPVDLNECIQEILDNLYTQISENEALVKVGKLPVVYGDAILLSQVFQNLISNSLKFRSDDVPVIEISAQKTPDHWQISVSDNGIGIQPEFYEAIFMPFRRLHTAQQYPGTGMGLSICKKIVERHGGKICVVPKSGAGSTIQISLPIRLESE